MQTPSQLRILIADDHEVVRRGLKTLLSSRPAWVICAEAATGREAITEAEKHRPDIVVIDISMPELNGLDAVRKLRKILPKTKILVFSAHYSDQLIKEVVQAGAHGYVLKSDADRDLFTAIEALVNHSSFFTRRAADKLADATFQKELPSGAGTLQHKRLSIREREVIQLVAEGKSSKEVASILGISPKTAATHKANLMRKLELHSIRALVRYAVRNLIVEP